MKKRLPHHPLHLEEAETDRRGVDEELRQVGDASDKREQPLYSLGSNSSDTIVIVETDGTASYLSPSVKQILGYRSGDLLGKNIFDHIHAEDAPDILAKFAETIKRPSVAFPAHFRVRHIDGHWIYLEAAMNSLLDDPNVKGIVVNVREDMEHNRAGEALRRCEESFRSIFRGSPIGIELYDADGRLLAVNSACLDIFGVSNVARVEGFRLFEDLTVIDEAKGKLRKGETVRYEAPFDFEKVKKNKLYDTSKSGVILIDVLITPLDPKGKESSGGYLVQVQDISERKQVEEALRTSEEKYRGLVEDTHIGISASDLEGKFTFANRALCEILGYSEGELAGSVFIITDITEHKQLEQALRKSETKYKDLADSLPQTIFELDEKGNFTFANRYGFQSYGYSPEDIDKGWNVLQLFIPEDQERVAENIRRIIAGENISGRNIRR